MPIPDAILDAQLDELQGTEIRLTSQLVTSYADAVTFTLATQAISGANYTKGNGTPDGRQDVLAPPQGTSVTASGTASHWAVVTTTGTILNLTGSLTSSVALTNGGTVNIGNYTHTARDAT